MNDILISLALLFIGWELRRLKEKAMPLKPIKAKGSTSIVEIGVEVTEAQLKHVQNLLRLHKIPFYVEPPSPNHYVSLEDLECQCEGK